MDTSAGTYAACGVCGAYADAAHHQKPQSQPTCDRCGSLIAVAAAKHLQFYPTWKSVLPARNLVRRLVGRIAGRRA